MGDAIIHQSKRMTYPAYKPSGVERLGEIPEHWEVKPLKRIFITLNGSTPKSGEPDYWDGDIPWATPDDLGSLNGDTLRATRRMITHEGYENCGTSLAPEGSLVLSTRAPIGHLAIAGVSLCTNQGCRCLVFREDVERRFYYYQFFVAKQELESWGQGSTFKELSRDKLTVIYLVSPPLEEQRVIVVFLDRETAKIDALIEKNERLIELLQEKRTALITQAVTKGLDPTVPMKDSGVEWLGEIPEHWEAKKIKFTSTLLNGYAFDSNSYADNGIPVIRIGDVGEEIDWDNVKRVPANALNNLLRFQILNGDVLLAMTGATIGKSSVYLSNEVALLNQRVGVIRGMGMEQEFLRHVVNSECFTKPIDFLCYGGAQENIGKEDIGNILTAFPPAEEQRAIAAFLDSTTAEIDALVAKIQEAIDRLDEYHSALISAAITGKIDVKKV